ncbi:hypothetical protein BZG36_02331 [Bifiguratus adelaidae]|uniref:DNA helicase n=1 Tax=Bifiguratus adelaidae TaxID=1938954 RepID=A0A261Y2H1_9FUNG|nr:hypothetical protein BZG36_02331 [Bifiguratus adelaidae]
MTKVQQIEQADGERESALPTVLAAFTSNTSRKSPTADNGTAVKGHDGDSSAPSLQLAKTKAVQIKREEPAPRITRHAKKPADLLTRRHSSRLAAEKPPAQPNHSIKEEPTTPRSHTPHVNGHANGVEKRPRGRPKKVKPEHSEQSVKASIEPVKRERHRDVPQVRRDNVPPVKKAISAKKEPASQKHSSVAMDRSSTARKRRKLQTDATEKEGSPSLPSLIPENVPPHIRKVREKAMQDKEVQLSSLVTHHDDLVRQLYFLEMHVTMLDYNPTKARSQGREMVAKYLRSYDLWSTVTDKMIQSSQHHLNKVSTRRALTQRREDLLQTLRQSSGANASGSSSPQMHDLSDRSSSVHPAAQGPRMVFPSGVFVPYQHRPSPKFPSVGAFLASTVDLDDEKEPVSPEEADNQAVIEARIRNRIRELRDEGRLQGHYIPRAFNSPHQTSETPQNFLIGHALLSSRLIRENAKYRKNLAKKASKAIERFWENVASRDDRLAKEQDRHHRRVAKFLAMSVKKKWKLVEKIVEARHKEILQELQAEKGKQHLNLILEHSELMLSDRRLQEMGTDDESLDAENTDIDDKSSQDDNEDAELDPDAFSPTATDVDEEEAEGQSSSDEGELDGLRAEQDLPIEDLLERYRYADILAEAKQFDEDENASASDSEADSESSNAPALKEAAEDESAVVTTKTKSNSDIDECRPRKRLRQSSQAALAPEEEVDAADEEFTAGNDEDDVVMSSDASSDDGELDALANDADVPITELLSRYGYQLDEQEDGTADTSASEGEETTVDDEDEEGANSARNPELSNSPTSMPLSDSSVHENSRSKATTGEMQVVEPTSADNHAEDAMEHGDMTTEHTMKAESSSDEEMEQEGRLSDLYTEPPKEITVASAHVKTPVPFLLRGTLREYQHVGLDWLANLYRNGLNGILADEMGLGKTIQTIALLAHLACEKGVWGPHLIVVPTSVMLNWEIEFKKWLPGFKILTYYGNPRERKEKRIGWSKENSFHVCITSYQLVCHDQNVFRRKFWHYLILDEAHNIKNFRSQRWQVLLNFNAYRRLLLTGTPLQNNLMELWSLLYFLMPNGVSQSMPVGFANQKEFQEWFSHPVDRMIENNDQQDEESRQAISKLHTVLRPYLLRRLKVDVEKQMPAKYEHVVYCKLSKRQRFLYDDFMSRAKTKETLASGNFLSVINCLMQLRKVCNHPDLFEVRPIITSFAMADDVGVAASIEELLIRKRLLRQFDTDWSRVDLAFLNFDICTASRETTHSKISSLAGRILDASGLIAKKRNTIVSKAVEAIDYSNLKAYSMAKKARLQQEERQRWAHLSYVNYFRSRKRVVFGESLLEKLKQLSASDTRDAPVTAKDPSQYFDRTEALCAAVASYDSRIQDASDIIRLYACITPAVVIQSQPHLNSPEVEQSNQSNLPVDIFHPIRNRLQIAFPDKRLLQYDCGKLQKLDILLRDLKSGGHRALIFTQMTKVLDVLETFLNIHGYRYLRLDGATKVEQRQLLTERFNSDPRILVFILSSRSGGLGINLTGADSVIFYDSDWNPAMDKQCQDRSHRIGQTRDVHIYRFVTEYTIEENIFKKANQKRMLDNVVIHEGEFTTDYFNRMDWWKDLPEVGSSKPEMVPGMSMEQALLAAEDEADANAAKVAQREIEMDDHEFAETSTSAIDNPMTATESTAVSVQGQSPAVQSDVSGDTTKVAIPTAERVPNVGHVEEYMLRFAEWEYGVHLGFGGISAASGSNTSDFIKGSPRITEIWADSVDSDSQTPIVVPVDNNNADNADINYGSSSETFQKDTLITV